MTAVDNIPRLVRDNTTQSPLAAAGEWIGEWTDAQSFTMITTSCVTDVDGTLYMEFTNNNNNTVASYSLVYVVQANQIEAHSLKRKFQFYRSRYVNGASDQTSFQLNTFFDDNGIIVAAKNATLAQDADALATRDTAFDQEVAEGLREGYAIRNKFGRNLDIDTGTVPEDVWNGGGLYTGFNATAAETLQVFSSDANDTAAGSGARTVLLTGLDADYNAISETVTLNGVTPVLTTLSYIRMSRAIVTTSGSSNTTFNVGSITARQSTTTANVMMVMPAATNQTQIACDTIPAGKTAYIKNVDVEMNRSNSAVASGALFVREFEKPPRLIRFFTLGQTSPFDKTVFGGISLPEKTDIAVRIISVSANNVEISAFFDLVLVDN